MVDGELPGLVGVWIAITKIKRGLMVEKIRQIIAVSVAKALDEVEKYFSMPGNQVLLVQIYQLEYLLGTGSQEALNHGWSKLV